MERKAIEICRQVSKVIVGKEDTVKKSVAALLTEGHMLLEDIPGVGKTTLSKALAAAVGLETKRIQFTPDTLPSDVTGFTLWDEGRREFRFQKGAVMTNILLADEINRTSPRTQSALLQAMEEKCVSESGKTYQLPTPFMVIATQNPYGSAGTMPLPPSQLDRFMMRLSLGRPSEEELCGLLQNGGETGNVYEVATAADLQAMQAQARDVYIAQPLAMWLAQLCEDTHKSQYIAQGLSPRGAISIARAARAAAYLEGRDHVLPADIAWIFADCAAHRMIPSTEAQASGMGMGDICEEILKNRTPPHIKKR